MMRSGERTGRSAAARRAARRAAVGAPLIAAAFAVAACSSDIMDGPIHDTTRDYLKAVAAGGSAEAFHGQCGGKPGEDPLKVLAGEGTGFTAELTGSVESGDTATVNVSITGTDKTPSPYNVDLRREGGTWRVCGISTGSVHIDVD
ncbi:hypothetical protein [Yinghuangia soli]|uniref:Lipoprotein n=1 Tax=Yinghuangia soli TaxID=2908204 RepID=A0AA41PYR1_9ACTN|nr:hypothetical protein [Yinghuangia soli]MCF2527289.1 hypothetical protein [Yinghuangia soli]